jgi:hypothetical protein
MNPKKDTYKPYHDSEMRHQFDSEDEGMDFMKSKHVAKKQDAPDTRRKTQG